MSTTKDDKKNIEIQIAKMYHLKGMSQEEIAKEFFMSRSNVSRILNKCIEDGIVVTTVVDPSSLHPMTAINLAEKFGLKRVIIGRDDEYEASSSDSVPQLAAAFLQSIIEDNDLIGVGSGPLLSNTVRQFGNTLVKADVIQLMGNTQSSYDGTCSARIAIDLSKTLGGQCHLLYSPLTVASSSVKNSMMNDACIAPIFKKYPSLNIAISEIQPLHVNLGATFKESWMSHADALQLKETNALSMYCGHYFDINGYGCDGGINLKTMSVSSDTLMSLPYSIGIACGESMLNPTLAVIRSKMINTLIIDTVLASKLISL